MFLRACVEDAVDTTLSDQHMLMPAHPAIAEEFLNIEQAARRAVDLVVAGSVSEEATSHGHFGQIESESARAVVERQGDLRPAERRPGRGSGEDHVVHLLGSQGACCLSSHHPCDGIDDIRLAGAIWTDDDGHTWFAFDPGAIGERLEAGE